jgi:Ca2+-binding EF-hand superfamily protein
MKKADTDGNGKLSVAEIVASVGNRLGTAEIERIVGQFDRDGDKELDAVEAEAVMKAFGRQ